MACFVLVAWTVSTALMCATSCFQIWYWCALDQSWINICIYCPE